MRMITNLDSFVKMSVRSDQITAFLFLQIDGSKIRLEVWLFAAMCREIWLFAEIPNDYDPHESTIPNDNDRRESIISN